MVFVPALVPPPALPPHVAAALARGQDWVGSWVPPGVLAVATLLGVVVVVWRRGSRRALRVGVPVVVLALLLTGAAVANTCSGYIPSVQAAQLLVLGPSAGGGLHRRGRLTTVRIPVPAARHLAVTDTYVYTPPGYSKNPRTRYPVAYLVHGTPGTSSDWFAAGSLRSTMDILIQAGLVRPMIVVAPDANAPGNDDTECLDASDPNGPQVASYLTTDVVTWIDAHYRTQADPRHRIVGGFSMGGYCALNLGLRNPEYGAIVAIEPYDNPGAGGRAMLATDQEYTAQSPGSYAATAPLHHLSTVFIGEGGATNSSSIAALAHTLAARGLPVTSMVQPGMGHTWNTARLLVAYGLVSASRGLPH